MTKRSKHILVIGATGGIGTAIVEQVIHAGFIVIATDIKKTNLVKLQKKFGDAIITYQCDLTKPTSFKKFYIFTKTYAHQINWIIHAAGFIDTRELLSKPNDRLIRKTFLINIESIIKITYLFLPIIKKNGGVIMISSTAGIWGNPQYPVYSASKGALNTFTQSLARQIANTGKRSIAICPGPTRTSMRERIAKDSKKHQHPNAIADVIVNIMNSKTVYHNGDIIIIRDGIQTLHSRITS